ncbi:MAG TPA: RidA family protein [Propionibacteriaceae bacterium]|jgi:enamine deaminase RidA (YjgF/YER057c/UK114 family)|nr:RidA family protein [Propionibacteriaceae bacterium]
MAVELINPPGLAAPEAYAHMSIATGSRTVYVSGQVARDAQGRPVGAGDLAAQVEQVYENLITALAGVGGTFDDIARMTCYVVDWRPELMPQLIEGAMRVAGRRGINPIRPITLIGVTALGEPDMLVEVEATAVLT